MNTPNIAVTFNPNVKGPVTSLRKIITKSNANLVDCDYRKITPSAADLEEIYNNPQKMQTVFQTSKEKAVSFFNENAIDCLILSGNPTKVDPRLFGKPLSSEKIDLPRAIAEMALLHVALQKGLPILGICGGLQILNTYLGGSIKDLDEADLRIQGFDNYETVSIDSNTDLANIVCPRAANNPDKTIEGKFFSSHYQVIGELGGKNRINNKEDYLKIVAHAKDTHHNIEASQSQYGAPVLGTQFHPEVPVLGFDHPTMPISGDIYIADDEEDFLKNKRIIDASIKAAVTYRNKQNVNSEVVSQLQDSHRLHHVRSQAAGYHSDEEASLKHLSFNNLIHNTLAYLAARAFKNKLTQHCVERRIKELKNNTASGPTPPKISWPNYFNSLNTHSMQEENNLSIKDNAAIKLKI